jgi:hypothetical protein
MKTIAIAGLTSYVVREISMTEGKIKLTLVPIHRTGVYSGCRNADDRYSDWKGYSKSHQERTPP